MDEDRDPEREARSYRELQKDTVKQATQCQRQSAFYAQKARVYILEAETYKATAEGYEKIARAEAEAS